jgi:hypothetical protein
MFSSFISHNFSDRSAFIGTFEYDPLAQFVVFEIPTFLLFSAVIVAIYSWVTIVHFDMLKDKGLRHIAFAIALIFVWSLWIVVTVVYAEVILCTDNRVACSQFAYFSFSKLFWHVSLSRSSSAVLFVTRCGHADSHHHLPIHHHRRHLPAGVRLPVLHPPFVPESKEDVVVEAVCVGGGSSHQHRLPRPMRSLPHSPLRLHRLVGVSLHHPHGHGGPPHGLPVCAV